MQTKMASLYVLVLRISYIKSFISSAMCEDESQMVSTKELGGTSSGFDTIFVKHKRSCCIITLLLNPVIYCNPLLRLRLSNDLVPFFWFSH
jgi:hypothetical protein